MILPEGGTVQVVGRTGSGKTFYAVRSILTALVNGRVVYTNIKLKWPAVQRYAKKKGLPNGIPKGNYRFLDHESNFHNALVEGACVFLDEAQLVWNSRDYKKTDETQREMLLFLTQARHVKCTINFITQHEGNVDAQMARVAVYIIRLRNWMQLPLLRFISELLGKPAWMNRSVASICDRDGKTVIDRDSFLRTKLIGDCYDTTQLHHAFKLGGAPGEPVQGTPKREHPGIVFMAIGAILVAVGSYFAPAKPQPAPPPAPAPAPPLVKPMLPAPAAAPAAPVTPSAQGFAAFRSEVGEHWCTDEESIELPRFSFAYQSYFELVNCSHKYRRGDVWKGCIVRNYYRESPTSLVLVLQKPQLPAGNFYVRLYHYRLGIPNPNDSRSRGGGGSVFSGLDLPGGIPNLEKNGAGNVIPPAVIGTNYNSFPHAR